MGGTTVQFGKLLHTDEDYWIVMARKIADAKRAVVTWRGVRNGETRNEMSE
jgi:hypothetical protein